MTRRPQDLMATIRPTGKRYVIAARISGPARTAFPGGPPKGDERRQDRPDQIRKGDQRHRDGRHAISSMTASGSACKTSTARRVAQPFADNGAFVLNAVENLTGSNALISLRTRATSDRPFTVVKELQAEAQARFQQEADALQQKLKRHRKPPARARTGRRHEWRRRHQQHSADPGAAIGDRPLQARPHRDARRAARRPAQPAQRSGRAGLAPRLHQYRAGADSWSPPSRCCSPFCAGAAARAQSRCEGGAPWLIRTPSFAIRAVAALCFSAPPPQSRSCSPRWRYGTRRRLSRRNTSPNPSFPNLIAHERGVARIHIESHKYGAFDIDFKPSSGWVLPSEHDYPADFTLVRTTLVGMAGLETIAPQDEPRRLAALSRSRHTRRRVATAR